MSPLFRPPDDNARDRSAAPTPPGPEPSLHAPGVALPLPPQYAAALALAQSMLEAARAEDWATLGALQARIPLLAEGLVRHWREMASADARGLESARIQALCRVLAVDAEIRRVSAPGRPLPSWLDGARPPVH